MFARDVIVPLAIAPHLVARDQIARATTMLKQADREADAQTASEIRRLNPRTAPRGGRHGDAVPRLEYDSDLLATLLAMAAHDLRQPLQVITGAHDLLAGLLHGDSLRFVLARAEDAATWLGVMLAELAEALQLHILARDPRCNLIPLAPLIADLAAEFAEAAGAKGIDLCMSRAAGAVFSHRVLLRGRLRNLLRNAIDYTPAGGRVLMLCRRAGAELRIEVHDNGPGIPEDMKARLFEAFARADGTRPEGMGLGLFIVKCAADLLGHQIDVDSTVGHGSCFAVITKAAAGPTAHRVV
jgi:two-component system phosphate regulon sensor histidine kinase PhoR